MAYGDIHNATGTICRATKRACRYGSDGHSANDSAFVDFHKNNSEVNAELLEQALKDGNSPKDALEIAKTATAVAPPKRKSSNPIRDRLEAAGYKYPAKTYWDEMGSSEKDLWEESRLRALENKEWKEKQKADYDALPEGKVEVSAEDLKNGDVIEIDGKTVTVKRVFTISNGTLYVDPGSNPALRVEKDSKYLVTRKIEPPRKTSKMTASKLKAGDQIETPRGTYTIKKVFKTGAGNDVVIDTGGIRSMLVSGDDDFTVHRLVE